MLGLLDHQPFVSDNDNDCEHYYFIGGDFIMIDNLGFDFSFQEYIFLKKVLNDFYFDGKIFRNRGFSDWFEIQYFLYKRKKKLSKIC